MKQIDENLIVEEYNTNKKSTHQIAQDFNTYPNKIRRILQKNGIDLRSKSQAQSVAIESGRAEHPTKGKPRTEEQKLQTSKNMEKYWENISDADRKKFSKKAKDRWEAMSSEEHLLMRQKAGEALRKTSVEGSKAEKFLYERLQKEGYDAIMHKKGLIEGQKFEIDIFLPELGIAIEIDGPQHFTPMFGEEHLRNYVKYDSIKNGLLVQKGFCVIRVKYLCKHISESIKRKLWNLVFPVVQKLENKFPPKSKRIIELEIS